MRGWLAWTVAITSACGAACPAAASDVRVAGRADRVSAYGGQLVWSTTVHGRSSLYRRASDGSAARLPVPASSQEIRVDLGPTAGGGVRAIYRRCVKRSCGIYEFDLGTAKELRAPKLVVPARCSAIAPSFFKGDIAYLVAGRGCVDRVYLRMRSGATRMIAALPRGHGEIQDPVNSATDLDGDTITWLASNSFGPIYVAPRSGGTRIRVVEGDEGDYYIHYVDSPVLADGFVYWSDWEDEEESQVASIRRAVAATGKACGRVPIPRQFFSGAIDAGAVFYIPGDILTALNGPGVFQAQGRFSGTPADCTTPGT